MNITIKLIPNSEQRPNVDGCDWFWTPEGDLEVRVSPLGDWRNEVLLGLHEAIEAVLCKHHGVTQEQVDAWDLEYDKTHDSDIGAGDDPNAPYAREHAIATIIEMLMAVELNVNWEESQKLLVELYPGPRHKQ